LELSNEAFIEKIECINTTTKDIVHLNRCKSVYLDDIVRDVLMKTVACISIFEGGNNHG